MLTLDAVAEITAEAGRLALGRIEGDYARWEKSPGHLVCDVDIAVDTFLRERLTALAPDAAWLSEETLDDPSRLASSRIWIVDSIDGTRDYLRRRSGWCVSVALIEDGEPRLAVLSAPLRDELWTAASGCGARRNGAVLQVAERTELAGARIPIDELPRAHRDLIAVAKPNSIALRIAMVAAGEADLVATRRWGNEWDIAAAVLIAAEAGAMVSDGHGAPLVFNKPDAQAFGVTISSPGIHEAAVARFADPRQGLAFAKFRP